MAARQYVHKANVGDSDEAPSQEEGCGTCLVEEEKGGVEEGGLERRRAGGDERKVRERNDIMKPFGEALKREIRKLR